MMNEQELMDLVLDHYKGESQTLTTGAEANFLKFKQLIGVMNEEEEGRWDEIRKTYGRNQYLQGGDQNDPVSRVVSQLSLFTGGLESIQGTLKDELSKPRTTTLDFGEMNESLEGLRQTLAEGLAGQDSPAAGAQQGEGGETAAAGADMTAISGTIEKYLEHSDQMASQSDANQKMLAERQQVMMEFIGQSNAQLTEALTQSQAAAQAQQLQTALQQVGNLFATYQTRTRDLQEELKSAQPSEVVIDLNTQMAENSDELIRQILEQLDQAKQQQPDQSPPQEES